MNTIIERDAEIELLSKALGREREARLRAEEQVRTSCEELRQVQSQLQATQIQLIQSAKRVSLGRLMAGIAHEINNPIGFVKSNLGTLREYCKVYRECVELARALAEECNCIDGTNQPQLRALVDRLNDVEEREALSLLVEDTFALLDESCGGVARIQEIVQNLKSFAGTDEARFTVANVNEIVASTLTVVWNELKYKCEVEKCLGDVPPILCSPGQLNHVFMTLLVNAAQAIQERGHIVIATDLFEGHIRCRVSDNGVGIREEHVEELFTPFFTTKPVGTATGLGLSISHGIIQGHGGSITFESEPGKGTTFTVLLPVQRPVA